VTVIQSQSSLLGLQPGWLSPSVSSGLALYGDYTADYWTIYRTQPTVKTVVDFLARNIAQLGLHVFRRVSDTDRERLADHPLAQLIAKPNPSTTHYRLLRRMVRDVCIYGNGYWLKIRPPAGGIALLAVPFEIVSVYGSLNPTRYKVGISGNPLDLTPDKIVHFREDGEPVGVSPLESLRRILAEEAASGDYREGFWQNGARMAGFVKRPATAPEWSATARDRFTAEFSALYSGSANSGKTAILEEGMDWMPASFNAEDSQYLQTRELTRTEVARAFHVPLPMVGILTHATYSNITEQHKNLYQDCLGPWLTMIQEDIELQLLPEFADSEDVYVEFNMAEKLKGSLEEQSAVLSSAVGRPWLTADEARARQNLPSLGGDAEQLVTPLNVLVGGQASPRDSAPPPKAGLPLSAAKGAPQLKAVDDQVDTTHVRLRGRHVEKWAQVLTKFFDRQRSAVLGQLSKARRAGTKARIDDIFDGERWDKDLHGDLLALATATATAFGKRVADALEADFDPEELAAWLDENSRIAAEGINKLTRQKILAALEEDDERDAIGAMFDWMRDSRAAQIAQSKVTGIANFGAHEGAKQGGAKEKTWLVNSKNPRSSHRSLAGSTVKLSEDFGSVGMAWPGDPKGGADELSNCQCSLAFGG
jgi:HK97 family phage portal protein